MQKIKIEFNKESFDRGFEKESLELQSTFEYNSTIQIKSEIQNITFQDRNELLTLFEKLRGSDINSLKLKFFEYNYSEWAKANFYEQQAFKSLVLIYHWLELSLSNPNDLDIKSNLYNEFIVDWSFTPGIQNTIYLINDQYTKNENTVRLLDKLVKLNLLCKLSIIQHEEILVNYFIPLLTPGVPIEYFKSESDSQGLNADKLWKSLLKDKSLKIKNWVNNRF